MLCSLTLRSQQVFDPISGLAWVALAEVRPGAALEKVELMMAHMATGGRFNGTEEPLLLPLTCWQVLHAVGDPLAADMLAAAHAELQAQAARITDPEVAAGLPAAGVAPARDRGGLGVLRVAFRHRAKRSGIGLKGTLSVSLRAVTLDTSSCDCPGDLTTYLPRLEAGALAHMMSMGHDGPA